MNGGNDFVLTVMWGSTSFKCLYIQICVMCLWRLHRKEEIVIQSVQHDIIIIDMIHVSG